MKHPAMTSRICIMNPSASNGNTAPQARRTLDGLKDKVVGFVDNSKPNFNHLVDDIGALMISHCGVKKIVKHAKRLASIPAPETVLNDLSSQCDLVITGSGD